MLGKCKLIDTSYPASTVLPLKLGKSSLTSQKMGPSQLVFDCPIQRIFHDSTWHVALWSHIELGSSFKLAQNEKLIFARWVYHGWLVQKRVGNFEPPPSIQSNLDRQKNTFWITVHLLTCFSQHWTRGMNCQSKRGSRNRGTSRRKEQRDNSSRILIDWKAD